MEAISPWYKGFQGSIVQSESEEKNGYEVHAAACKSRHFWVAIQNNCN